MHNRFKNLLKALIDGDTSTARLQAEIAQRSIDNDRQPLEEKLAALDEQQAWLESTLKLHLPDESTATNPKPTTYKSPKEVGADGYTKKQRGQYIREAALLLVKHGKLELTNNDVLANLRGRGINFSIKRPQAAIAATLGAMKEFERTETGTFRYIGEAIPSDALPLMESVEAH